MKPALPTASVAYGLNGPSATAIVDNATPAGLHLSTGKFCPNKRGQLCGKTSKGKTATAQKLKLTRWLCWEGRALVMWSQRMFGILHHEPMVKKA